MKINRIKTEVMVCFKYHEIITIKMDDDALSKYQIQVNRQCIYRRWRK